MNDDISILTLAAAKKYTDDSIAGAGGLEGKPCQIQSIEAITGGNRVTFLWEDNDGVSHTDTMDVMNGVNGTDGTNGRDGTDGLGIKSVAVIPATNHLIITYDDDTTEDAGEITVVGKVDSVNGCDGDVVVSLSVAEGVVSLVGEEV